MIFVKPSDYDNNLFWGNILKYINSITNPTGNEKAEKLVRFELANKTEYYHTGFIAGIVEVMDYDSNTDLINNLTRKLDLELEIPPLDDLGPWDNTFWTKKGMEYFKENIINIIDAIQNKGGKICAHVLFDDELIHHKPIEDCISYKDEYQVVLYSPFSMEYENNYKNLITSIEYEEELERRRVFTERMRQKNINYQHMVAKEDARWSERKKQIQKEINKEINMGINTLKEFWLEEDKVEKDKMTRDELVHRVSEMCIANKVDFLFIIPNASVWSNDTDDIHLQKVIDFHNSELDKEMNKELL